MKTIAAIYNNPSGIEAIDFLESRINTIFEGYATLKRYFFTDLKPNDIIKADAYMLCDEELLYPIRNHLADYRNIITLYRSIGKEHLSKLTSLPKDIDVLVVSETLSGTMNTISMLYDIGFTSWNLVPYIYDAKVGDAPYNNFDYAITFNAVEFVPKKIKNIIDLGFREIRFETLLMLKRSLNLNSETLNNRLIRYSNYIIAPDVELQAAYIDNYVKDLILRKMLTNSDDIIIGVSHDSRIIFSNKQAYSIFGSSMDSGNLISDYFDADTLARIDACEEDGQEIIDINNIKYMMTKSTIFDKDFGLNMGYYLNLQDESTIRNTASVLNTKLHDSGLFAKHSFMDIISTTKNMNDCISIACKAAKTDFTLLISGESGTGKELFAQSIHNYSPRKDAPFVAINCAALPESLLESILFGYEPGAFTGAGSKGKIGLFEQANSGTIFLDEIGDISPKMQSSLLRVLQEKQIMKIGSDKVIGIDVRVIVATNKDLHKEVLAGNFRNDLYYRLNVIQILIPPLNKRKADILPLLKAFLGKRFINVTANQKNLLMQYDWPGNIRELENACTYYKTFNSFPAEIISSLKVEPTQPEKIPNTDIDIKCIILNLLAQKHTNSLSIGRTKMLTHLHNSGVFISDGRLRVMLAEMQEDGTIIIGRGRQGTVITDNGIKKIRSQSK